MIWVNVAACCCFRYLFITLLVWLLFLLLLILVFCCCFCCCNRLPFQRFSVLFIYHFLLEGILNTRTYSSKSIIIRCPNGQHGTSAADIHLHTHTYLHMTVIFGGIEMKLLSNVTAIPAVRIYAVCRCCCSCCGLLAYEHVVIVIAKGIHNILSFNCFTSLQTLTCHTYAPS